MKITLVAGDFMQSGELRTFGTALKELDHEVTAFLADGKKPTFTDEDVAKTVRDSDFVLLAVSNSFDETLRAGKAASEHSVPFGIYAASGPDCYLGENLKPLRDETRLIFVFNDSEVLPAEELFPNAAVAACGSPNWEKFHFPELTRKEARERLTVSEGEILILATGDKDLILNILIFALTIEAAGLLAKAGRRVQVVIGLHPGDPNALSSYANLGRFVPANVSVIFMCREAKEGVPEGMSFKVLPTPHALPGADMVVTFTSMLGFEAACQRIPVICFFPGYGLVQVTKEWEQCRNGTAIAAYGSSPPQLAEQMELVLAPGSYTAVRLLRRQEEVYPAPATMGTAVSIVSDTLSRFRS